MNVPTMNDCRAFVASVFLATTEGREPMTYNDAFVCLCEWLKEGVELPKTLTAKKLADLWNDMLERSC